MDPLTGAALLGAGGSILGGIFGNKSQNDANRANRELAEYQWDRNVEMWKMQNEYNLPSAQMQRLRDAGLNPNLVYGNGSVTGNTVGSAPSYEAPNIQSYKGWNSAMSTASQYMANLPMIRAQEAQTRNQTELGKSQMSYVDAQALTEVQKQAQLVLSNARSKIDLKYADNLQKYAVEASKANVDRILTDIQTGKLEQQMKIANHRNALTTNEQMQLTKRLTEKQIMRLDVEIQKLQQSRDMDAFDFSLRRQGINPNDDLIVRLASRVLNNASNSAPVNAAFDTADEIFLYKPLEKLTGRKIPRFNPFK